MGWESEGLNAAIVDLLDGYEVAKRGQPEAKVSTPMTKPNEDYLPDQVSEILAKMTPGEQGVMSQFLGRVMQEQERLSKSANSDFLDELKRYLAQYLAALAGMDTGDSDPALDTQFKPGPKPLRGHPNAPADRPHTTPAMKALADRLLNSPAVRKALAMARNQDVAARRMEYDLNPESKKMRDAEEAVRKENEARQERVQKSDGDPRDVPQDSAEETFGIAAQRRRMRPG